MTAASETVLGVDNRKLAIWVFLSSEFLFFGAFISTFLLYQNQTNGGPGVELFNIPFTSISSFVLLMSSLTMVLAHHAHSERDMRKMQLWTVATALLGMVFIAGQIFEFATFNNEGLGLTTSPFSSAFFVLTGFHGVHVTVGIMMLLSLAGMAKLGKVGPDEHVKTEVLGLYWHFVDVIWVIIFTVVYLIPVG